MSEKLRKRVNIVLLEKRIAELIQSGRSQKEILTSIGITSLGDLEFLSSGELLDCLSVLNERQLSLFDVA